MRIRISYFSSLLFAALALGPAMAHLLALPNKIGLSRDDYLTVQQIYRGWALLGIVVLGALVSTGTLALLTRRDRKAFLFALGSFLCIAGTQVVFWTYTYPANQATNNWTMLPENWTALRTRWEYSHAASAVLNVTAVILVIKSLLAKVPR